MEVPPMDIYGPLAYPTALGTVTRADKAHGIKACVSHGTKVHVSPVDLRTRSEGFIYIILGKL